MDHIRSKFTENVAALCPVLSETYRALGRFQNDRTVDNQRRVLLQLQVVAPLLSYFRQYVPADKQGHFLALAERSLGVSERIVAFGAAVDAVHLEFTVKRGYLHRDSGRLREVLESCRSCGEAGHVTLRDALPGAFVQGVAASPGVAVGPAFGPRWRSEYRRAPAGSVLVAVGAGVELIDCMRVAAGVVTDQGCAMCHAAIVARELRLPCVVGARQATRRIEPGWQLQVDGSTGAVARLSA